MMRFKGGRRNIDECGPWEVGYCDECCLVDSNVQRLRDSELMQLLEQKARKFYCPFEWAEQLHQFWFLMLGWSLSEGTMFQVILKMEESK